MLIVAVILALAVGMIVGFILGVMAEERSPGYNASPFSDEPDPRRRRGGRGYRKHDPSAGSEDDVQ